MPPRQSDAMVGQIVRRLVDVPAEMLGAIFDLLDKLCSRSGQVWFGALKLFLLRQNPWPGTQTIGSELLETIGSIVTPAVAIFTARDCFGTGVTGSTRFSSFDRLFSDAFVRCGGKVEMDVAQTELHLRRLEKASTIPSVVTALGGEEAAEIPLAQMFEAMRRLQKSFYCYVRGMDGVLLAVGCFYAIRKSTFPDWAVYSYLATDPASLNEGELILSR